MPGAGGERAAVDGHVGGAGGWENMVKPLTVCARGARSKTPLEWISMLVFVGIWFGVAAEPWTTSESCRRRNRRRWRKGKQGGRIGRGHIGLVQDQGAPVSAKAPSPPLFVYLTEPASSSEPRPSTKVSLAVSYRAP